MAVLTGTVVEKSEVYMARSGHSRWPTFTMKVRQPRGIVVTVYGKPHLHEVADEGEIVEISGKWTKGHAFSMGTNDSIVCRGKDKEYVERINTVSVPEGATRMEIALEYVSRPKYKRGDMVLTSKSGDNWISIPVALVKERFGSGEWPNRGFGTLTAMVTTYGINVSVHSILDWKQDEQAFSDSVPLNAVYFGHGYIQFNINEYGFHVHEDKLPFPSLTMMNEVRESFTGDLVLSVDGHKVRTGHWDSATKSVKSEWVIGNSKDIKVSVSDEVLEKFQAVHHSYKQQQKWNEGVKMIKDLISKEKHSLEEIVAAVQKVVPGATKEEVMDAVKDQWPVEYDQAYFNGLAKTAKEIYPYADGFVCVLRGDGYDSAVIERTEAGAASYIFDLPDFDGGIKELITIFNGFNLLELRREKVAEKIGLKGVAIHTDLGSWSMKIATTVVECEARKEPLVDGHIAILAVILGIKLRHSVLGEDD